jgi:hypothetical protein
MIKIIFVSLAVFIIASIVWWQQGLAEYRSRALWRQVERGPGSIVDFTKLGPPDWDKLFIFHPYTPKSSLNEALGYRWPDAERSTIEWNEGVMLVVFMREGRVVGWFDHPRNRGDLQDVASTEGYPREKAQFIVLLDQAHRLVLAHPRLALQRGFAEVW